MTDLREISKDQEHEDLEQPIKLAVSVEFSRSLPEFEGLASLDMNLGEPKKAKVNTPKTEYHERPSKPTRGELF